MVACADIADADGISECYLDCSGSGTCPDGMACIDGTYCATPAEPAPMYGGCAAGCAFPGVCAVTDTGSHAVCVSPCFDAGSCNPAPPGSGAQATCEDAVTPPVGPAGEECYLDCSAGVACPTGMSCIAVDNAHDIAENICMWPSAPA